MSKSAQGQTARRRAERGVWRAGLAHVVSKGPGSQSFVRLKVPVPALPAGATAVRLTGQALPPTARRTLFVIPLVGKGGGGQRTQVTCGRDEETPRVGQCCPQMGPPTPVSRPAGARQALTRSHTWDTGGTYVRHHRVVRVAGGRLGGLWAPVPRRRLSPTRGRTGLTGGMGEDGSDAQLHLEVQEVVPGVLEEQVLRQAGAQHRPQAALPGGTGGRGQRSAAQHAHRPSPRGARGPAGAEGVSSSSSLPRPPALPAAAAVPASVLLALTTRQSALGAPFPVGLSKAVRFPVRPTLATFCTSQRLGPYFPRDFSLTHGSLEAC